MVLELKYKAHIGDSLASLFARTLMMDLVISGKILNKEKYFIHAHRIVSNEHFTRVAGKLELFGDATSFKYYDQKALGTRYEAAIYDIYLENGFDAAFRFFKDTAYKIYLDEYKITSPDGSKIVSNDVVI